MTIATGTDDNRSWNCGVEGPTSDPANEKLRTRQVKNYLAATLLSFLAEPNGYDGRWAERQAIAFIGRVDRGEPVSLPQL